MKMKNYSLKALTVAVFATLISQVSFAGSWNYGCTGKTQWGQRIVFDRGSLVILPNELANGKLQTIGSDGIETLEATDVNSGFQPQLVFTHKYTDGSLTRTFVEQSSTKVKEESKTVKCTGNRVREIDRVIYKKNYLMQTKDTAGSVSPEIKVELECFDFSVSACG
jgi:hypothetical protein